MQKTVSLPNYLNDRLVKFSKREDVPQSTVITIALTQYLDMIENGDVEFNPSNTTVTRQKDKKISAKDAISPQAKRKRTIKKKKQFPGGLMPCPNCGTLHKEDEFQPSLVYDSLTECPDCEEKMK